MTHCTNCGTELREKAHYCDHCGKPVGGERFPTQTKRETKPKKSRLGWLFVVIGIVAVAVILNLTNESSQSLQKSPTKSTNSTNPNMSVHREQRYVHETINIRAQRSTNSTVVGTLNRGEDVEIDSLKNDWVLVYRNGVRMGYVSGSLLKENPIPAFEIVSWNWYTDSSFGTDGAVVWNVQIRNNTNKYITNLKVEFTTYDAGGSLIDTDYTYVSGLSPGGISSAKSYATFFGKEQKASIRVDPSSIY